MEHEAWIQTMKNLESIRLFSSLLIRKTRKGALASAQEVDALFRIALKSGSTPLELSREMGISKTIVSRLIEQLTLKMLITKHYDRQDRRSCSLRITKEGRQELDNMYRYYLEPVCRLEREMDEESLLMLFSLIHRANQIMTKKKEEVF